MASFAKTLSFFLKDKPLFKTHHQKYAYPAVNHELAFRYAEALDILLDWSKPDAEAKPVCQLYHKMVAHTFKHVLHKHKKTKSIFPTYKVFAVNDFHTSEGQYFAYCDYPLIEDLYSLKREIGKLTDFRIDTFNEVEDKHLDLLSCGALSDLALYSFREFKRDFEVVNPLWEDVVAFAKEKFESGNRKMIPGMKEVEDLRK